MLSRILFLLTSAEKRRGILVLMIIIIMAAMEVAGVVSVMPFLSVLGNPDMIRTNPVLAWLYEYLEFKSAEDFLVFLGLASFALILVSAVFRSLTHYTMNRFIEMRRHRIGERLLETYLRQPYAFFLNRHSSDLAAAILSEVDQLIVQVIRPGMLMLAYAIIGLAIIILLIAVDVVLAAGVAAVVGGVYAVVYLAVRGLLGRVGSDRVQANQERFTAAGEALGGIKDIKLLGREQAYLQAFRGPSIRQAKHLATSQTLALVPRYLVEAVGFGGIIILTLVLIITHGGITGGALGDSLPLLGLYTLAGYRLLPAAQHVYKGVANLRFGRAALDSIHRDLMQRERLAEMTTPVEEPITPSRTIAFEGVTFTYPNAAEPAVNDIDLNIRMGSFVGLVGGTGAGKTTLVDVFLGLLRPEQGMMTVDGEAITENNLRAWQRAIGYVPQDIFLTDSSLAENIALGVPREGIDYEQVRRCACMAQLDDFIRNEMADGYDTLVGERGVRLSGGQRQRIGIARALYHEPAVLVFDEATSALDTVTERAVMGALHSLHHEKTVILIAHRLSTVRGCDEIVFLEHGRIAGIGTYDDLCKENDRFRAMAATTDAR